MSTFRGTVAVVTGASGGIGEALSIALAREGARLLLAGRSAERLEIVAEHARDLSPGVETFAADLAEDGRVEALADRALAAFGGVDVLIHSIGLFLGGAFESPVEILDRQYRINTRVPYLLTQKLLPSLIARQGQVVFVNSSAGLHPARAGWVAYSASKHALRAVADGLRDEVNKKGVRVLTVFPGRTATPMQEEVHRYEERDYDPERFLQPRDVAATVLNALALPRTAEVTDLQIRPMRG
ncbi:MAG TPA: SDR family NAD(P)-dependent oxidoreductase [Thermoanaerobaculia bacterium]|jgi:NAD(P)-dependent dehydrogenase (short-subunit alcohol dehydrogenase family)|nr:SDR family NAD(P)-dependent oxidoreductase [Thermoanaerobaculia bacterium]